MRKIDFETFNSNNDRVLLPSFRKCHAHDVGIASVLSASQVQDLSNPTAKRQVYRPMAQWIIDLVFGKEGDDSDSGVLNHKVDITQHLDDDKCITLSKARCIAKGLVWGPRYVQAMIGKDEHGKKVMESVHRLVLWAKSAYNTQLGVAMHQPPSGTCRKSKDGVCACVNPMHMSWGTQSNNVEDGWNHKKRRRMV